ncbi:MAG: glycoside hydrolase 15-related [Myxococcales bacterium]|nr:glycoside hydrolase 15-related [Myxococcales bacterium]
MISIAGCGETAGLAFLRPGLRPVTREKKLPMPAFSRASAPCFFVTFFGRFAARLFAAFGAALSLLGALRPAGFEALGTAFLALDLVELARGFGMAASISGEPSKVRSGDRAHALRYVGCTNAVTMQAAKIHDYGLIGDGRSAALISRHGSLDWLCWQRFDSAPIFSHLLDETGSRWSMCPTKPARCARQYVEHTNVLETAFVTADGRALLIDAMTIASEADKRRMLVPDHELVRRVTCIEGEVEIEARIDPRPDFGRARSKILHLGELGIRWEIGTQLLTLRADVPLVLGSDGVVTARMRVRTGEAFSFSLTFDEEAPAVLPPLGSSLHERIERTIAWWRAWIARAHFDGPYRDSVLRSALALKLMSFAPSGAIIAAPTTSLPEALGGNHNWDYRYCWLRDASFTARAFLDLGYIEEAQAFGSWLVQATRLTSPQLQVLYDVYGNGPHREHEVPSVSGYRSSRPVRIGNAASMQLQLDMYGEVIDAASQLVRVTGILDRDSKQVLRDYGRYVSENWSRPDRGIWEPREAPRPHTHSRLMCWVALERLIGLHQEGRLDRVDVSALAQQRDAIRVDIEQRAFDPVRGCYMGALGCGELDASVLLMSWYHFHPGDSPRMRSTYARICERLGAGRGLLYRYERSFQKNEGAFWICSFWAVEHLVRGGGSFEDAIEMFDAARRYGSDLGLMAEEVDPKTGDGLGNFPQAYTHVGLISAALSLAERHHAALPLRGPSRSAREVAR